MATNENEGGYVVPSVFMYGGEITETVHRPGVIFRLIRYIGSSVGIFGMKLGKKIFNFGTVERTVKVEGILEKAKNAKIKRT